MRCIPFVALLATLCATTVVTASSRRPSNKQPDSTGLVPKFVNKHKVEATSEEILKSTLKPSRISTMP